MIEIQKIESEEAKKLNYYNLEIVTNNKTIPFDFGCYYHESKKVVIERFPPNFMTKELFDVATEKFLKFDFEVSNFSIQWLDLMIPVNQVLLEGFNPTIELKKKFDEYFIRFETTYNNNGLENWFLKWNPRVILDELKSTANLKKRKLKISEENDGEYHSLYFEKKISKEFNLYNAIYSLTKEISSIADDVLSNLKQEQWKIKYESDEILFTKEVIVPLLRKMNFNSVHFNHGTREYGKDVTFSELDKFGTSKNYAIQVKAGNISGKVNSEIDELIGQIEDAFSMPFYQLGVKEPHYISTFIIAISGSFSSNAKEKIANKIPKGLYGSIYFLDKEKFLELIEKYWD